MIQLNLIVIRSSDIEKSASFYSCFGLDFTKEQHGNGPVHYAAYLGDVVFEIYPLNKCIPTTSLRLGFEVSSIKEIEEKLAEAGFLLTVNNLIIKDPDGHHIHLTENN